MMLIVVRHGSTKLNGDGERMRGWLPVPLSRDGMMDAFHAAQTLKKFQFDNIDSIYSSILPRAIQTAQEIASELDKEVDPKEELLDWNVGKYTGQDVKKTLDTMHYYIDNPNDKIPQGESYNDFLDRCVPFLKELVSKDSINIVVTHNRVVTLIKAMSDGNGKINGDTLKKKGPIEPGGIMIIEPDWAISVVPDGIKSYA